MLCLSRCSLVAQLAETPSKDSNRKKKQEKLKLTGQMETEALGRGRVCQKQTTQKLIGSSFCSFSADQSDVLLLVESDSFFFFY